MAYYVMCLHVEDGQGDYGSRYVTIYQGETTKREVEKACKMLRQAGGKVSVFRQRSAGAFRGRLVPELSDWRPLVSGAGSCQPAPPAPETPRTPNGGP
jgi:hypothetical protein